MRTGLWRTDDSTCKSPDNSRRLIRLSEKGLSATFRRDERTKLDGGCLARLLWISESFLQGGLESFSEVRLRLIHLDANCGQIVGIADDLFWPKRLMKALQRFLVGNYPDRRIVLAKSAVLLMMSGTFSTARSATLFLVAISQPLNTWRCRLSFSLPKGLGRTIPRIASRFESRPLASRVDLASGPDLIILC